MAASGSLGKALTDMEVMLVGDEFVELFAAAPVRGRHVHPIDHTGRGLKKERATRP